MAYDEQKGELEIRQDLSHQRRGWKWQRLGWLVMALFLLSAIFGLFGKGILGDAVVGNTSAPLWAEYNRFGRAQAETTELRFHLGANLARNGEIRFWLSREYLEKVRLQQVIPQPSSVEAGSERVTFIFRISEPGAPMTLSFQLEPETFGSLRASCGLESGESLAFSQFIYP